MNFILIAASNISHRFLPARFCDKFQALSKIEFYSEDPYIYHLDCLFFFYFTIYSFIYFSLYALKYPNFFMHYQLQTLVGFPLKSLACLSVSRV